MTLIALEFPERSLNTIEKPVKQYFFNFLTFELLTR